MILSSFAQSGGVQQQQQQPWSSSTQQQLDASQVTIFRPGSDFSGSFPAACGLVVTIDCSLLSLCASWVFRILTALGFVCSSRFRFAAAVATSSAAAEAAADSGSRPRASRPSRPCSSRPCSNSRQVRLGACLTRLSHHVRVVPKQAGGFGGVGVTGISGTAGSMGMGSVPQQQSVFGTGGGGGGAGTMGSMGGGQQQQAPLPEQQQQSFAGRGRRSIPLG